jgi:hypothetical protein
VSRIVSECGLWLIYRIREVLLILHQSWFFEGDVHHVRKEVDEEGKHWC